MTQQTPTNSTLSAMQEIITPAEAKFWQEWADKAPALVRVQAQAQQQSQANRRVFMGASIAVGAALGVATFTKYVQGKWKWVSGLASAGTLAAGASVAAIGALSSSLDSLGHAKSGDPGLTRAQADAAYTRQLQAQIGKLEQSPDYRKALAAYLSASITDQDIQKNGLENAVIYATKRFAAVPPLEPMGYAAKLLSSNAKIGAAVSPSL